VSLPGAKLGWLNPLIYKLGASNSPFNDVVDGGNNYCDEAGGFSAARGWDAATGWGTLNYGLMKQQMVSINRVITEAVAVPSLALHSIVDSHCYQLEVSTNTSCFEKFWAVHQGDVSDYPYTAL